ncbi:SMC domain protein [Desulfitobacterium hafniense DCB-2]|uniref:Nuclease SbcCD subunit C n=1 Tax=Desulfitobacterium hafniense (strain DSM 10664 / DCB-2) TaxID=272564 RepID=B8FW38_DESHD|nr:SMC family ATPase [Desulfitobacterium hafniense]ACL18824.1 SMC domain protein [Desulfitobacterium hafniense DCB-2]
MRPIKLKIKGLNSFIDTQEIDFSQLTSRGLFGIFGPTGSGKSTILDGMTLALYGAVARGSTNYMNTNCESLQVSYEFQIAEKDTKTYRVDREFRRDKKSGNVRTHSAKILLITAGGETVLEEQVREVTKKSEEIIGLTLEDFTRTVVLPQGKFSEFLRLEGRDRREMLERLFNLQRYGDELSSRLGARIRQELDKANVLAGQLKSYEECSEELLEAKNKELSSLEERLVQFQAELKKAAEDFHNGKEVWELQEELNRQEVQKTELEKTEAVIKESEIQATLGERSLRVKPYLDQYEDTLGKIATTQVQVAQLEGDTAALSLQKKEAEAQWEQAGAQKDKVLPALRLREQSAADAILEKKKLESLIQEKKSLQENIGRLEQEREEKQGRVHKGEEFIAKVNADIQEKEQKVEALTIDQEFKQKINEALLTFSRWEEAGQQVVSLGSEVKIIDEKLQEAQEKGLKFSQELEAKTEILQGFALTLQNLEETCPGDSETLVTLQEKLNQVKEQWARHHEYSAAISRSEAGIRDLLPKLDTAQQQKAQLTQKITELESALKKIERENLAYALRVALVEGEACPVCGSTHHQPDHGNAAVGTEKLEEIQAALREKKEHEQSLYQEMIQAQEQIKTLESTVKDCREKTAALGEAYKAYDPEAMQKEFETLRDGISRYTKQKGELEAEINRLTQEKNQLAIKLNEQNTIKAETKAQLESRGKNLELAKAKYEAYEQELTALRAELNIQDLKQEHQEIAAKEKEKAGLESELKGLRDTLKKAQARKEFLSTELSALTESLKESLGTLKEKESSIQDKHTAIKAKVGEVENIETYQKEVLSQITRIEQIYAQAETRKNETEKQYNECYVRLQSAHTSRQGLAERSQKDKESLDKVLQEEQIENIEEAKSHLLSRDEIEKLKKQVKDYQDSLTQIFGAIGNLQKKLGGRSLTAERWEQLQRHKEEKEILCKGLEESKIEIETHVKTMKENLVKKKDLLKSQAELERQLGLLRDLEKLFRGKRFVEFVAAHQLKYVSMEAGKRLREITGGNYGLEVDQNGKFLIRDYKNGGAQRDATTLSGGETFLASLSLALALSAQIQLKGTAPLELFFLDEGFGTLDDNLLEVVMDSLERLHHDRLSVGIISHVDSIKNRVPVKLMVTPAQAGLGGSKVAIEVS